MRFRVMKPTSQQPTEMLPQFGNGMSWLQPEDLRHLVAAQGYAELGMFTEANAELEGINPQARDLIHIVAACLVRIAPA